MLSIFLLGLLAIIVGSSARSVVRRPGTATSPLAGQGKERNLRQIAAERDVEVEGSSVCQLSDMSLADLRTSSSAIVYGRIIESRSFFEDRCHPSEQGENITTEYTVDVLGVLKDKTLESMPPPDKPAPAPLRTPVKIARNGGVVSVNGHRASVKIKGYDELLPGRQYVFFLNWSADYKAYTLTYCIFGAVMVRDDLSLNSLGPSKEFEAELRKLNLQSLLNRIQ